MNCCSDAQPVVLEALRVPHSLWHLMKQLELHYPRVCAETRLERNLVLCSKR